MENSNELLKEEKEAKIREEIYAIDVRLQELDSIFEQYEDALTEREEEILSEEELNKLIDEYHELKKKKKELAKNFKKSKWEMIPLWMAVYAVCQFIFSFFLVQIQLSFYFTTWLGGLIYKAWETGSWLFYVLLFVIPVLSLLASLIIFLKLKDRTKRKIFAIIFAIHGLETLVTIVYIVYMLVVILK